MAEPSNLVAKADSEQSQSDKQQASEIKANNQLTIYIDEQPYLVNKENNLLAGVLSNKLNLPYFCWHPSMGSVGACRQCAVTQYQDENDTRGRIIMACMTPVVEGMRISINDNNASEFREQVIGAMMTNHPHDCPVCAEGGECHLQDMTVMTGHSARQYTGKKRTFTNQYLGELVGHEMNRCITCYRCVRFYKDYAGGKDFDVFGSKNQVYFGRQSDGVLESEFSGNLIEVCPTGVFTNKLFSAHYTRKWDLQSAPSICAFCSVGCNTSIGERYGSVRRVVNRYNERLNGHFLCDRGRFGLGFVNGDQRLRTSKGIRQQSPEKMTKLDVAKALVHFNGQTFIGIGSSRASLEANYYLKTLVGAKHFSPGFSSKEMAMAAQHKSLLHHYELPDLAEVEQSDLVLIIGEDITQTSPIMALSVRQALRNASLDKAATIGIPSWQDDAVRTVGGKLLSPLFSMLSMPGKLDDVCQQKLLLTPDEIEQAVSLLNEQLLKLLGQKPLNNELETPLGDGGDGEVTAETQRFISELIKALTKANKPLIISGWSMDSARLFAKIKTLMATLHGSEFSQYKRDCLTPTGKPLAEQLEHQSLTRLALLPKQCNSVGLLSLTDDQSLSLEQVLLSLQENPVAIDGIIIVENELAGLSAQDIALIRKQLKTLIILDHSVNPLTAVADIVLPVAAVSEGDGHYVNYQGQVQRYYQVHAPVLPIQDSWRWLNHIDKAIFNTDRRRGTRTATSFNFVASLDELNQYFSALAQEQGQKWPIDEIAVQRDKRIARQSHRGSGRTSQMANISVHETKTTQAKDNLFSYSMEGLKPDANPDMPFTWAPGWNSNQSINMFQTEIGGGLIQDDPLTHHKLCFEQAATFCQKWPVIDNPVVSTQSSTRSNTQSNTQLKRFVNNALWFQTDWQANFTPEFTMLSEGSQLTVSSRYADEHDWQPGQFIAFTLTLAAAEKRLSGNEASLCEQEKTFSGIAQLWCCDEFPENLVTGNIFGLGVDITNIDIAIFDAEPEAIALHQQTEQVRYQEAKSDKESILKRLKAADQSIPIRMIAGGLDDV